MADYNTDLKDWGASGSPYPSGYNYEPGKPPVDEYDNHLTYNIINDIQHLVRVTNDRIETDKGGSSGEPSNPEASHIYHDQSSERLEIWDASSSAWRGLLFQDGDTMSGALDMGGNNITDSNGVLTLDAAVNTTQELQYSGNEVATQSWVNSNADVPNADYADSAATADNTTKVKGNDIDSDGDGQVDAADEAPWTGVTGKPSNTETDTRSTSYKPLLLPPYSDGNGGSVTLEAYNDYVFQEVGIDSSFDNGIYMDGVDVNTADIYFDRTEVTYVDGTTTTLNSQGKNSITPGRVQNITVVYDFGSQQSTSVGLSVRMKMLDIGPHTHPISQN